MVARRIKQASYINRDKRVSLGESASDSLLDIDYPIFCFRHLHSEHDLDKCSLASYKFPQALIKKLQQVSKMSWDDIQLSSRQGSGTEKIPVDSIRKEIPVSVTKDVSHLLVFRFCGKKGRILGFRNRYVFHVIFIDTALSLYKH